MRVSFESPRLIIRSYMRKDAPLLYELIQRNKPHLLENFPKLLSRTGSKQACRSFIRQMQYKPERVFFALGLFDKKSQELVGHIVLKKPVPKEAKCELGYLIDTNNSGKGLASEAVISTAKYCHTEMGMAKLIIRVMPHNIASKKVALKAGFQLERLIEKDFRTSDGILVDVEHYGKLRSE